MKIQYKNGILPLIAAAVLGMAVSPVNADKGSKFSHTATPYDNSITWSAIRTLEGSDCKVCHVYPGNVNNSNPLNAYGWDLRSFTRKGHTLYNAVVNAGSRDSDGNGYSNQQEIQAGVQPGWKNGGGNIGYTSSGSTMNADAYAPRVSLDPGASSPILSVSSAPINFGSVDSGVIASHSLYLRNAGSQDLWVSLDIAGSSEFSVITQVAFPFRLTPGQGGYISLGYTPIDGGTDTATLSVSSNDPNTSLVSIPLSGSGNSAIVNCDLYQTASALDFGTVTAGNSSSMATQLVNIGSGDCVVNSLALNNTASFAVSITTPTTPFVIRTGATANISIDFVPAVEGSHLGKLSIDTTDSLTPLMMVSLSGIGEQAVLGSCNINPGVLSLDFGSVLVGQRKSMSTTMVNNGSAACVVSALSLQNNSGEFSFGAAVPAIPFTLDVGIGATVELVYQPAGSGSDSASMVISSNDPDMPQTLVSLLGSSDVTMDSCDLTSNTSQLDFGTVLVGQSKILSASFSNVSTVTCQIDSMSFANSSGEFSLSSTLSMPYLLAGGSSVAIGVKYQPSNSGSDAGQVQIYNSDPVQPMISIGLVGSGQTLVSYKDLDIKDLNIRDKIDQYRNLKLEIELENRSGGTAEGTAELVGVLNGYTVYSKSISVSVRDKEQFEFPPYYAKYQGTIYWTLRVQDGNSDNDVAYRSTRVEKR